MKTRHSILGIICLMSLASCTQMSNSVSKYDRSKVYLKSDQFAAKRITVPGDLDQSKVEDYYPVPTIADQGDPKVPSLVPPSQPPEPTKPTTRITT